MPEPQTAPNAQPRKKCFVAYPALPEDGAETVENAIAILRSNEVVSVKGWKNLQIGGNLVITTICQEIRQHDVLIADITGLNPNVLFELGYAMALRKRVWLVLNPNIEPARKEFDRFQLLSTVGYRPYANSKEICEWFYKDRPYETHEPPLFDDLLQAAGPPVTSDTLFYLRPDLDTEAALCVTRLVRSAPMRYVIDDPAEVRRQPLGWYVQHTDACFAVVCHLLGSNHQDWALHNAKHALVAGIAHGLTKPLLMLAHEPYASPLDYHDLVRVHRKPSNAEAIFREWLLPQISQYEQRQSQIALERADQQARKQLKEISVGEPVAEHESESILDYYVEIGAFQDLLRAKYAIVVGRKGTGKTATLLALQQSLSGDPRNHVCLVRPVGYDVGGLIALLKKVQPNAERGYLVESFWKFLLYTELAKSAYEQLKSRPTYYAPTEPENLLLEFVEQNASLIKAEFSLRLAEAVGLLAKSPAAPSGAPLRISELLHSEMLSRLRTLLRRALDGKAKVAVLVDDLDKGWHANGDAAALGELLLGLFGVSKRVGEDFQRNASDNTPVNLSFILFLRSDVYAAIAPLARERDKLPTHIILWNEPDALRRIVEARFMRAAPALKSRGEVWEQYFTPTFRGIPLWDHINMRILPRPRDLIQLVKSSLESAVNRGRTRVEERDIEEGGLRYSRFAVNALIAEAAVRVPKIEDLLLGLIRSPEIVDAAKIADLCTSNNVDLPSDELIRLLTRLTFLGPEVAPGEFKFIVDEQDEPKFEALAARIAPTGQRRYRIHPAFHPFLEVGYRSEATDGQLRMDL